MPAINIEGSGPTGEEDAALQFTPRGFAVYTMFEDTYGNNVRVQESSSAEGPHNCDLAMPGARHRQLQYLGCGESS